MDDIVPKLVIALVTAAVGFFWLLAYKHPRTFKAVATPFVFLFAIALIFSLPFWFAASMISDIVGGSVPFDDNYDFIKDHDTRAKVSQIFISEIAPFQRYPSYVALCSGAGLLLLAFFKAVSSALQKERAETIKHEADAKQNESKESVKDATI